MDGPFNPLSFPVMLRAPDWWPDQAPADGRLPFVMLVVALLEPAQLVELGLACGQTYAAMCQAVQAQRLDCQCLGVELNDAPEASGGPRLSAAFRAHHAARYGSFSRLAAAEAIGAADFFADSSVDLLHLAAGLSSAQAGEVFRRWLPKLSARAAVLVSNIHPAEGAGGLSAFYAEASRAHAHFELHLGQGQSLGLLLVGAEPVEELARLARLPAGQQASLRDLVYRLGQAAAYSADHGPQPGGEAEIAALHQTLREQTEHIDQLQGRLEIVTAREREIRGLYLDLHQQLAARDELGAQVIERDRTITAREAVIAEREAVIAEREATITWLKGEQERLRAELTAEQERLLAARDETISGLRAELALAQAEIRTIHAGRLWRLAQSYWQIRYHVTALFRRPGARAQ